MGGGGSSIAVVAVLVVLALASRRSDGTLQLILSTRSCPAQYATVRC